MVTKNSTTITLTGEEQTVQFDRPYPYFWVQNLGDNDVLISMDGGIVEGADGVITVPAGGSCCTMHGYNADRLYLLGSGRVQVMGTGSAFNPFKLVRKGGVDSYYLIDSIRRPMNFADANCIAFGDSIMCGYYDGVKNYDDCFIAYFKTMAAITNIRNEGVGGASWSGANNSSTPLAQAQAQIINTRDFIFVHCGTNDYTYGATEKSFVNGLNAFSDYVNSNKKDSCKVIIITPVGRARNANNYHMPLNKYREMITLWALQNNYVLVDGSKLGIPDADNEYTKSIMPDGIHPIATGHRIIANALSKLL